MNEYNEFIDASFDQYFEDELSLPWLPWVGKNFSDAEVKTLILGESTYNWNPKDEKVEQSLEKSSHLRWLHYHHAINYKKKSRYVRNIEKAIFLQKRPSDVNKEKLWGDVVYHNLVLVPMKTIKQRPSEQEYSDGWKKCLELVSKLEINESIVYGLEWKKIQSLLNILKSEGVGYEYRKQDRKIGVFTPKSVYIPSKNVKFIFIRHPSSFFSWRKWGNYLSSEIAYKNA